MNVPDTIRMLTEQDEKQETIKFRNHLLRRLFF